MRHSPLRRSLLIAALTVPVSAALARAAAALPGNTRTVSPEDALAALERASGGRLGLAARDTGTGAVISHRADERFPLCSTAKLMAVAAVLRQTERRPDLLRQRMRYTAEDLAPYSVITPKNLATGMTVAQLCAAALQYSDNTALNLLLRQLGGPEVVTAFARSIGDDAFRLDRGETSLSSAAPGDERDTSTPAAMERSLRALVLENALRPDHRTLLREWLQGNTTGGRRIRAGVPRDWTVGDKTGSGSFGTTNDIAVLWRPAQAPVCIAAYFTQARKDAPAREDVIASAARIVADAMTLASRAGNV